jgi:hypothetical protein
MKKKPQAKLKAKRKKVARKQVKKPAAAAAATPILPKRNLRSLALEIVEGKVFGSWSINNPNTDLHLVFMVLLFCKKEDIPEDTAAVYEYVDQAGPRSINGMPIFTSCRFLSQDEYKEVCEHIQEIKKIRQAFLNPSNEEPETCNPGHPQPVNPEPQLDSRGRTSGSTGSCNSESSDDPASNRLRKLFKRKPTSPGFTKKTRR